MKKLPQVVKALTVKITIEQKEYDLIENLPDTNNFIETSNSKISSNMKGIVNIS